MGTIVEEHARDIEEMRVRGAGAIARHACQALASWARSASGGPAFREELDAHVTRLQATRPTAVSLRNALAFVVRRVGGATDGPGVVVEAAEAFVARSEAAVDAVGEHGAPLVEEGGRYLTHCNSQAALAVFRHAREAGRSFHVVATETRPWRQGLITVRQLAEANVPATLVVDSAMWRVLEEVDGVVVGCDTLARNGDVVNKVGTAALALMCRERDVPFRVAAETYKVDLDASSGADVPVEERSEAEVADPADLPVGVEIWNPVFDVTPHPRVRSVITEVGELRPEEVADAARKAWR